MFSHSKITTLAHMREEALIRASKSPDPLTAQQYRDLAKCYAGAIDALRHNDGAIVRERDAATISWRSVRLWTSNDPDEGNGGAGDGR